MGGLDSWDNSSQLINELHLLSTRTLGHLSSVEGEMMSSTAGAIVACWLQRNLDRTKITWCAAISQLLTTHRDLEMYVDAQLSQTFVAVHVPAVPD